MSIDTELVRAEIERRKRDEERALVLAELARRSLAHFAKAAWPIIEPATPLQWSWAHSAVTDHLEACYRGEIRNLAVIVPPGSLKPCDSDGFVVEKSRGRIRLGDLAVGDQVLTHRGRFRRVDAVADHGRLPVLKITTDRGRVIRAEGSHPFLTARGWVQAKDLTNQDVLAGVHKAEECGTRTMSLEEARAIGYIIGDGCVAYSNTSFTNNDPETMADFRHCMDTLGFDTTYTPKKGAKSDVAVVKAKHKERLNRYRGERGGVRRWCESRELEGKTSYTKVVPQAIMAGDDELVAEFLAAYWACDGGIQDRRDAPRAGRKNQLINSVRLDCVTVSKRLASDLHHLMTRLGLSFRVREREITKQTKRQGETYRYYQLYASDQDTAAKFMRLIGPRMRHEKRHRAAGMTRSEFDAVLNPDQVVSVEPDGDAECRCLSVSEDHSFSYQDVAAHNSVLVMQMFPAWLFAQDPGVRMICAANVERLALQSALQCRTILHSDWYQRHFPHVEIDNSQDTKTWFTTTARGFRKIAIVGSAIVGERADYLIVDDPNDPLTVMSKTKRDEVKAWWDTTAFNRVNHPKTSRRIMVAQRTHRGDLIGHCVERYGFEPLVIPMEFEPNRRTVTSIGWTDPRTEEGELLQPDRFGPAEIAAAKIARGYRTLYQMDPIDADAGFYRDEYFKNRWRWGPQPGHIALDDGSENPYSFDVTRTAMFAVGDAAADAKSSSDDSAVGLFAMAPRGDLVWIDALCRKLDIPEQPELLAEIRAKWPFRFIGIEAVGANRAMFQYAQRMGLVAIPMTPLSKDKVVHAQAAIIKASQGQVWLPAPGAMPDFDVSKLLDQLLRFGSGDGLDDLVDLLSYAVDLMPRIVTARLGGGGSGLPKAVDMTQSMRVPLAGGGGGRPRFGGPRVIVPGRAGGRPGALAPGGGAGRGNLADWC